MSSDEEAQRRPLSGGRAAQAQVHESAATQRKKKVGQIAIFCAVGAEVSGLGIAIAAAVALRGTEPVITFYWVLGCVGLWLFMLLLKPWMIMELMHRHQYRKMEILHIINLCTLLFFGVFIVGGGVWSTAQSGYSMGVLLSVGIASQIVPWGFLLWALQAYIVCARLYRGVHPIELGSLRSGAAPFARRRASTVTTQGSGHSSHPSRRSATRGTNHGEQARTWGFFHSNHRGSQVSTHDSTHEHQHTDSSIDSEDNVLQHDEHPHQRAPFPPTAPGSVHIPPRRDPSHGPLPEDNFELPRRSNTNRIAPHSSAPTAPHPAHHAL